MAEKHNSDVGLLDHCKNFCKIARELREFEVYRIIDDLGHRMFHFRALGTTEPTEPDADVYRKCFRITFIGDPSAPEKRKFIEDAFDKPTPFQIENFSGDASDINEAYYYYYEEYDETARKFRKSRFAIINTPSLSENDQMTDIGELHTEAVVFVFSGNTINESEKSCLEKIKYQVDNNFLFFVHPAENHTVDDKMNNLDTIFEILSVQPEEKRCVSPRYISSNESSSIGQYFVDKREQCSLLLARKIRNYMLQYYERFEINVGAYLRSLTEFGNFNKDINRIEDKTFTEVDWISSQVRRELDQRFPLESSYSADMRAEIKKITQQLSEDTIEQKDVPEKLSKDTQDILRKWTRDLEDIIADYHRNISHEVSERLHESGRTYRSSIPLNHKIELQAEKDFHVYLFETGKLASVARFLSSGALPGYFIGSGIYAAGSAKETTTALATLLASNPAGWAIGAGVIIALAITAALMWSSSEERKNQAKKETGNEIERDIKPFNHHVSHAIRIEFEEVVHFSQEALQNIFKEIRDTERKRIIINNACPAIKAITEDSLSEKISRNLKAIESFKIG